MLSELRIIRLGALTMIITAKQALSDIRSGDAYVDGYSVDGDRQYAIITNCREQRVDHVEIDKGYSDSELLSAIMRLDD
jgi:hypothetical protein